MCGASFNAARVILLSRVIELDIWSPSLSKFYYKISY
nr:MAG TPA: hypothetical protein [Caudoviricetes sp.]